MIPDYYLNNLINNAKWKCFVCVEFNAPKVIKSHQIALFPVLKWFQTTHCKNTKYVECSHNLKSYIEKRKLLRVLQTLFTWYTQSNCTVIVVAFGPTDPINAFQKLSSAATAVKLGVQKRAALTFHLPATFPGRTLFEYFELVCTRSVGQGCMCSYPRAVNQIGIISTKLITTPLK